jgi:hypothetical protein
VGRLFGLILILGLIWLGVRLYTGGSDQASEGPVASPVEERSARPAPVTERVRERVAEHMQSGSRRVQSVGE